MNGTSGAAATVAGAAALLAQMRPSLDGPALQSLLVGYAQPERAPPAVGAGVFRLGAAAVGEVAAHRRRSASGSGAARTGTRPARSSSATSRRGGCSFAQRRGRWRVRGAAASRSKPRLLFRSGGRAGQGDGDGACGGRARVVTGLLEVAAAGSQTCASRGRSGSGRLRNLLATWRSTSRRSRRRTRRRRCLTIQAGSLVRDDGLQIRAGLAARHPALLGERRFVGVLARLRDLLPGSYSFGITGRGPTACALRRALPAAARRLADAAEGAEPSRARVRFKIK